MLLSRERLPCGDSVKVVIHVIMSVADAFSNRNEEHFDLRFRPSQCEEGLV
jgi:predicted metallopeptidase